MTFQKTVLGAVLVFASSFALNARAHESPCELSAGTTIRSVKDGAWSNSATWGGRVPGAMDTVNIVHQVTVDQSATVAGIKVNCGASVIFDPTRTVLLASTKNVIVSGTLRMRPANGSLTHTLRFTQINENAFVGGGMDPLETDVGLWVMGQGQLDLQGTKKAGWLRAAATIAAGATNFEVDRVPEGWQADDEISIAPTLAPTPIGIDPLLTGYINKCYNTGMMAFDERRVTSVSGKTITVSNGTTYAHPKVGNRYTAEVMNLTRNVRVEGTAGASRTAMGRTHIFIHSKKQQNIKYVQVRYVGPRKGAYMDGVDLRKGAIVLGRYGIHFHHSMEGARGSVIEGNVVRDHGSRAYVPHVSHGITLRGNVAYEGHDIAYWWDEAEASHHSVWEGNIAAKQFANGASTAAYLLGKGEGNIARANVAVGVHSNDPHGLAAYNWAANNEGIWIFDDNLAHNNGGALNVWQNTSNPHDITRFDAYHNCIGIYHGAYGNSYRYQDLYLYGNLLGLDVHAAPADGQQFHDVYVDGAGLADYNLLVSASPGNSGGYPVQFRNITSRGAKKAGIYNASFDIPDSGPSFGKNIDVIHSDIQEPAFGFSGPEAGATNLGAQFIRVQPKGGQAFILRRYDGAETVAAWGAKKTNIPAFAPTVWGKGTGMKVEYFDGANFDRLIDTRREHTIHYDAWSTDGAHYQFGPAYSIRYTGFLMFQSTEKYRFTAGMGGGFRCTIDGQRLRWFRVENNVEIDAWADRNQDYYSDEYAATAGKLVPFTCEYFNTDRRSGFVFKWKSAATGTQSIPQSQIYPPNGFIIAPPTVPVEPPANQPPIVAVGSDIVLYLPANKTRLTGTATDDSKIAKLQWMLKSGAPATIVTPNALSTEVTGLVAGDYIFALNATDDTGAEGFDEVRVTVKPAEAAKNLPPVVSAGPDQTITLPVSTAKLVGTASDPDGKVASVEWTMISGAAVGGTSSLRATTVDLTGLKAGEYLFRLTATDDMGATSADEMRLVVKPQAEIPPAPTAPIAVSAGDRQYVACVSGKGTASISAAISGVPAACAVKYKWSKEGRWGNFVAKSPFDLQTIQVGDMPCDDTVTFQVEATDCYGRTARSSVRISTVK